MSTSNIWFPLYVNDYLGDTMHLSRSDHGTYFLLLCAYYKNQGPLPDDDKTLANIVKETVTVWMKLRSPMAKFFKIEDGKWIHARADREIQRRKSVQHARQQAANTTNARLGRKTVTDTVTVSHTDTPSVVQSQSQSHKEGEGKRPPISQNGEKANNGHLSGSERILRHDELKRVEKALDRLRANHSGRWPLESKAELNRLKERRKQLIAILDLSV